MRNEGPFIVEWVTWYRMLGFTDIVVVTNNCTDRSPELLDCLQAQGLVHHLRCDIPEGQPITQTKLNMAKGHVSVRRADWVFVCDVDEFLVIHKGDGLIRDLFDPEMAKSDFLGMSINWKTFGTDGVPSFVDAPVHQQFLRACPTKHSLSLGIKSIFRQPKRFAEIGEHGPRHFSLERQSAWGSEGLRWVNSKKETVAKWRPRGPYMRFLPREMVTHEVAQINHYMLRSQESYSLKQGTLSPVKLSNRYTAHYYDRANSGKQLDTSALRYLEPFSAAFIKLMLIPNVAKLHSLCCADHLRLIAEKAGRSIDDDPRYQDYLEQSENPNLYLMHD
jgi:hypothetical protein